MLQGKHLLCVLTKGPFTQQPLLSGLSLGWREALITGYLATSGEDKFTHAPTLSITAGISIVWNVATQGRG